MLKTLIDTFKINLKLLSYECLRLLPKASRKKIAKEALILAPRLPPYVTGGIYRPMSWAKYAKDNGWTVTFITKPLNRRVQINETSAHLERQLQGTCKLFRLKESPQLEPSFKITPRVDGSIEHAINAVAQGLDVYNKCKPDIIVATGPSFDYFIAAFYLSKLLKVPFVIDYRDEWTENPFDFVKLGNADIYWEKRIFASANHIVLTTELMLQAHAEKFHRTYNLSVIKNGWEPSEHIHVEKTQSSRQVELMFIGNMGLHSPPFEFLNDLQLALCDRNDLEVKITFVGKISDNIRQKLEAYSDSILIDIEGFVPRNKANEKMAMATALLLFTPKPMERYIPGKMFDYAASGTPVIVHGVKGSTSEAVLDSKSGFFVEGGDTTELRNVLIKLKMGQINDCLDSEKRKEWLQQHSREKLAEDFYHLLDKVAEKHQ